MIRIADKKNCCGCTACYAACPVSCIQMREDKEGFKYPFVDIPHCIDCHKCEKVCQETTGIASLKARPLASYAVINNDSVIRTASSSGGLFSALAEATLNNGGIVYGAAYDKDINVIHKKATSIDELRHLRGSKYVQSDLRNCLKDIQSDLNDGHQVLFSGTPCQVNGLLHFLGKEYHNLTTVDVICHGVPSPLVFTKYKEYLKEKLGETLESINFRDKSTGWKNYSVITRSGSKTVATPHDEDPYMQLFLSDTSIRPSCSNCPAKGIKSHSDITIGDLWGAEKMIPEMNDDRGLSFVSINSSKGITALEQIKEKLTLGAIDYDSATCYNPSLISSVSLNPNRNLFFSCIRRFSFEKSYSMIISTSFATRAIRKTYHLINKLK